MAQIPSHQLRLEQIRGLRGQFSDLLHEIMSETSMENRTNDGLYSPHELNKAIGDMDRHYINLSTSLKREINTFNQVASLPFDVIVEILRFGGIQDILAASKISHSWREAALNCPSIWSNIDLTAKQRKWGLFEAQIARSGAVPLTLYFPGERENNGFFPRDITDCLVRARKICNFLSSTFRWYGALVMPSLESLHVILTGDLPLQRNSAFQPRLRHLSISCKNLPLVSFPANWAPKLQTLHIRGAENAPFQIVQLVIGFLYLEELLLQDLRNNTPSSPHAVQALQGNHRFLSLKILSLVHVTSQFHDQFLNSHFIQPCTSVHINSISNAFIPQSAIRNHPVKSMRIDYKSRHIMYDHGSAVTELGYKADRADAYMLYLPTSIPLQNITSLICINGVKPPTSEDLAAFSNLIALSFTFAPSFRPADEAILSKTFNQTLIFACPCLSYLGISLRDSEASNVIDLQEILISFCEEWREIHGEKFNYIGLEDRISEIPWTPNPSLRDIVKSVEVGPLTPMKKVPIFPKLHWFDM